MLQIMFVRYLRRVVILHSDIDRLPRQHFRSVDILLLFVVGIRDYGERGLYYSYTPRAVDPRIVLCVFCFFCFFGRQIFNTFMMMTITAFFCQISDPRFGGLYMTLYNTFFFSGWLVPNTFALKMVDVLTMADRCSTNPRNDCSTSDLRNVSGSRISKRSRPWATVRRRNLFSPVLVGERRTTNSR